MNHNEIVTKIIAASFQRANNEIPGFEATPSPELPMFDVPGAILDSLNLITFVFILEDEIKKATGLKVKITTEDVLNNSESPFRSVQGISDFLLRKVRND
ncbi:MAG: hypothetical protein V4598_08585 [Bdellovibrionota bacterium]